ncbi:MAG: TonB-dependent receptor [Bacteroidia bacterium]|nr:TonB-dependent receptor [Bacteroidia bacterium]
MRHSFYSFFVLIFFLSGFQVLMGQEILLKGVVKDAKNQEPLIGVKVVIDSSGGAYTNMNGVFELKTTPGKHQLDFSYVGYDVLHKEVDIPASNPPELTIEMGEVGTQLDIVVISGSQYEKKLGEETVSMDVIKPYLVENTAAVDLADVTRKVPGVSIVDGQVSIRGMSGYAYGAGSRVQVLVDDMPLLGGDLGDVKWEFVPMENVEQIEVIKGASSALYGSSAMNGVINVRTGYARSKPETKIQLYSGFYRSPRRQELQWWDWNENPFYTGFFVSDRRKWKDVDFVTGGNLYTSKSYLEGADETRGRLNVKTRWKPKNISGLSAGINFNLMSQKRGRFILWTDKDAGAYRPFPNTSNRERYNFIAIDPHITYLSPKGERHTFRGRYFNIVKLLRSEENALSSKIYRGEYQFHKPFANDFHVTAGVVGNYSHVKSNLFSQDSNLVAPSFLLAGYTQLEKKFNKLSLVAGMRYELNIQPDFKSAEKDTIPPLYENTGPVLRAGANYQVGKATFLRASYGEAYRFPALSERYIEEDLVGLRIFSNPNLKPEYGHTIELGVKQGLQFGAWRGYADLAFFWADYFDMIEFRFVILQGNFGFQSQNITRARIAGMEVSAMGEGKIGTIPVRFYGGYTFNYPADLETDPSQKNIFTYMGNLFGSLGALDSLQKQTQILRYRNRHMAQFDIEADYKKFTGGFSLGYNAFMERIDEVFDFIIPGVTEWRAQNNKGSLNLNARVAYHPNPNVTISLIGKNITNREISQRPGLMEPPGLIIAQYQYKF